MHWSSWIAFFSCHHSPLRLYILIPIWIQQVLMQITAEQRFIDAKKDAQPVIFGVRLSLDFR